MYPSYFVLFFFGLLQLQLHRLEADCPPNNRKAEAQILQFCSDSEVTSNDIYIDSSAASNRVTNCTCSFKVFGTTQIFLQNTSNQINDCRTRLLYRNIIVSKTKEYCDGVNLGISVHIINQNFEIVLINEQIISKIYCLHLGTENSATKIKLKCFQGSPIITTDTTPAESITTTKATTSITFTSNVTTTDTTKSLTTVHRTTTQTAVKYSSTETSTYSNVKQDVPFHILAPAAGGGVLVVIGIIILAIVCSRRKTEYDYDEPGPKTNSHTYINQSIVTDVDDDEDDEMRVNELYRSIDSEPQDDEFAGGYAEINSSDASHSRKSAASINKGEKIYSVPSNRPLTQVQGGDVYSMPVKKPKNRQEKINDTPVYAMPDKEKNKQNQETGPVYAIADKKNKNENSKTDKNKTNSSKPAVKKRPPPIASKPAGVKGGGDRKRKGNVNSERLNCSEIELNVSSNNSNQSKFNVSEKTGYAEVL